MDPVQQLTVNVCVDWTGMHPQRHWRHSKLERHTPRIQRIRKKNHQYHKSIRRLALRDMATLIYPDHRELFHRQGENIHKFLLAHTSEAHTGRGLQTGIHPGQHKLQRVPFAGKTAFLQNGGRKKGTKKRPPNGLRQRQATLRLPVLYVLLEHNQQLLY